MRSKRWQDVKRILAIRLDNIGDVIMLTPALRALHKAIPQVRITLMASPAGSQVAPLLPWVNEVFTWRAVWQDVSGALPLDSSRELELVEELRKRDFDAALIFTSFTQSPYPPASACYLAGIPLRIGQSKEFGGSLLTHWGKPPADHGHQVDRNLALLKLAGIPEAGRHMELQIPEGIQAEADELLRSAEVDPGQAFILLAPGASCAARRYDPRRFAVVTQLLAERTGLPVVIVGSQREKEILSPVTDLAGCPGIVSLVGQTSVPQLAGIVRRAALVIANNSAGLHLADAFRVPMVILYSGTEFESQWRPRFASSRLLRVGTECSPCYRFNCPFNMECLDIAPEEVVEAALDRLEKAGLGQLAAQALS